jgi:hypothetical protein
MRDEFGGDRERVGEDVDLGVLEEGHQMPGGRAPLMMMLSLAPIRPAAARAMARFSATATA